MPSELSTANEKIVGYTGLDENKRARLHMVYGEGEQGKKEWEHAQALMNAVQNDFDIREQSSDVHNGIPYSDAYDYNRRKAINYSPPRNPNDDREVSMGLVHEKVVTFCAMFTKYLWKAKVKSYWRNGKIIKGLGEVLRLATEHSRRIEGFNRKLILILWEVFTQGNAFILEDWQVRLIPQRKAYMVKDGNLVEVDPDNMDYTYEFLEGLTYEEADPIQERKAVSVLLDGRQVIFSNPELEEVQDQERITIEISFPRTVAEQLFGSLKRWKYVPNREADFDAVTRNRAGLFDAERMKKPEDKVIAHIVMEKFSNRYNLFLNGVMMLPSKTSFSLFYPRRNYPLTNVAGERLKGSIYARSIPAKVKFNADFLDWALKGLAEAFEQGLYPSILAKGKYTLTRDIFRSGQVTHGVKKEDYEFANPDRAKNGARQGEFTFVSFIKDIIEKQTASETASGGVEAQATATAIATAEANMQDKLGYLLDGITLGMIDLMERRIETIESKYTTKERKTLVDGKEVDVFQDFTVVMDGYENHVQMSPEVGTDEYAPKMGPARDQLFHGAFQAKKRGVSTKYFIANPDFIRKREFTNCVEIEPEIKKQTSLQMMQFWEDVRNLKEVFPNVNDTALQEEYLQVSGKPENLFKSEDAVRLEQMQQEQQQQQTAIPKANTGSMGRPTVKPNMVAKTNRVK